MEPGDKSGNLKNDIELNSFKAVCHDSSSCETTYKRMGGRRRDTLPPGNQIPENSGNNARQDNRQRDVLFNNCL